MKKQTIKVTILLEKSFWVGIFERNDGEGYAVARKVFGDEPTDPEIYLFVINNYHELKFTEPQDFELVIKRKNPKRLQREVRQEMLKAKEDLPRSSHAQDVLRIELEKNKKLRKQISKIQKEEKQEKIFQLKQAKKKQKHRGH